MNKHHIYLFLAGAAIGYFAAATLAPYQPWTFAYSKGQTIAA